MFKYKNLTTMISWVVVVLWMALIFVLSAQPAAQSNNLSKGVTDIVVETVEKIAPTTDFDISKLNHIIRKNAHFFAYLTLGILVLNAIRKIGVNDTKGIAIAFLACVLYAISDEAHQLFVSGRGGQIKDVLLDSAGVAVGIGLYLVLSKIKKKEEKMKYIAPILIVIVMAGFFALYGLGIFFALDSISTQPIVGIIITIIFAGLIGSLGYTLVQRIKEIRKEDDDDLSKY